MKNDQNIITYKIKYETSNKELHEILSLQKMYSNLLHVTYNRLFENNKLSTKELTEFQKNLNGINLNSHLMNSAIYDAKAIIKKDNEKQIVFGGKKNLKSRSQHKISKDEFKLNRLSPVYSIGEANQKGNRLFEIIDDTLILFKPTREIHCYLNLIASKSMKKNLLKLKDLSERKIIPITYQIDQKYVYLSFDYDIFREKDNVDKIENRIFSIDVNPNYIGYSVIDWIDSAEYKIIDSGLISLKPLNDEWFAMKNKGIASNDPKRIYNINKRKYEVLQIGNQLVKLANHYRCSIFSLELLEFKKDKKHKESKKSKRYKALCNNLWDRIALYSQIKKFCSFYEIRLQKVIANYSSFIGNLIYRDEELPDPILASIEISRRAFEFYHQYIVKDKEIEKNIVMPKLEVIKDRISISLEEIGFKSDFDTLVELYSLIKKSKQKYRLLLEDIDPKRVSSKFYIKRHEILYNFI